MQFWSKESINSEHLNAEKFSFQGFKKVRYIFYSKEEVKIASSFSFKIFYCEITGYKTIDVYLSIWTRENTVFCTYLYEDCLSCSYSGVAGYLRVFLFSQILELHCALCKCLAMRALVNISLLIFSILTFLFCYICHIFVLIHVPKFWSSCAFSANMQRAYRSSDSCRGEGGCSPGSQSRVRVCQKCSPSLNVLTCNASPLHFSMWEVKWANLSGTERGCAP